MSAPRVAVLNIVGLSHRQVTAELAPNLHRFANDNAILPIEPLLPAVTCSVQSTYLTGRLPSDHGIVGNGWYDRDHAEHRFWKQSNRLVTAPKLWEVLRRQRPEFTCAKMFWWFNMHHSADYAVTPRPMYPADGRKVFDVQTKPLDLHDPMIADLGPFPFPYFWGPGAGLASSAWIADSARWIERRQRPDLSLVYLPHLDYDHQRHGPDHAASRRALAEVDALFGELLAFYREAGVTVVVLSEYGITPVDRPIHLNRLFRQRGWLEVKQELGREMLLLGDCRVFAVADHQVAHVYLPQETGGGAAGALGDQVAELLEATPGVGRVLRGDALREAGLAHPRAGDLVAVADERSWFTYYYWEDDRLAPDFARTVDIHRKCGYDPVELFIDPAIRVPKLRLAQRLLKKKLGFRMLMDVVPLDASLVGGSHGRRPEQRGDWPVWIGPAPAATTDGALPATGVFDELVRVCGGNPPEETG